MASTLTTFDAFLKENYTKDQIANLTYRDRPLLGKIKKEPDHGGDLYVHPLIYANPQGVGATLAVAQEGATQASGGGGNLKGTKWQVTYGDYSGAVEIGDKVIQASRNNVGAFLRNQKLEIDGLYDAWGDTFGYYIYANSGFALGSGTESSGVCTLGNAHDAVNFEVGMIVQASANDGTSTAHALLGSGSKGYVIAVNKNAGTFTVSTTAGGSAGTPTGWTGTMYFFRNGDFGGTATPNRFILGLGAWVPAADPGATAFEGVDRSVDVTRLGGVRLTSTEVSGKGTEARIKLLCARMAGRSGSKAPTDIFLHPEPWQNLADALESRGLRDAGVEEAKTGYMKIKLATAGRWVNVYSDRFCPSSIIWALNLEYVKLASMAEFPHVVNGDGLTMLRKSDANNYEYRITAYPAFCVPAPGYQGRVPTP